MDYLLLDDKPVKLFTDHRNLLFVFSPLAFLPSLARHIFSKVQRWATYLLRFDNEIEHINAEDNIFADILSRWMKGYRDEKLRTKIVLMLQEVLQPHIETPLEMDLLTKEEVLKSHRFCQNLPRNLQKGKRNRKLQVHSYH